MKKVKWISAGFMITLCFILSSELYQNYVGIFSNQLYYINMDVSDKEDVWDFVGKSAEKMGMEAFYIFNTSSTARNVHYDIMGTSKTAELLKERYQIAEGSYNSFFSGTTKISVHDFDENIGHQEEVTFYFTGSYEKVLELRRYFNISDYPASYVHGGEKGIMQWLVPAIWAVAGVFLVILTWFDIQFQKKENFLLISMGKSRLVIILQNILKDTLVFAGLFLVIRLLFEKYIYLGYENKKIILICLAVLVLNHCIYFMLFHYDYKQLLYNATINESTLSNCYILKVFTMLLAVASLSVSIPLIRENVRYIGMYKEIGQFKDYGFIDIIPDYSQCKGDEGVYTEQIYGDIYQEYMEKGKVALSTYDFKGEKGPILMVNHNTWPLVAGPDIEEPEEEFCVFVPDGKIKIDNPVEDVLQHIILEFGIDIEQENYSYNMEYYKKHRNVLYFKYFGDSVLGFDEMENPVFVYCNPSKETLSLNDGGEHFMLDNNDTMICLTPEELQDIKDNYPVEDITYTGVEERSGQDRARIERIALLNTVISVFMLILEGIVIGTIIKMEYIINAKILAIKKVLGYSVLSKNKSIFLLNLFAACIGIVTMLIAALMYKLASWQEIVGIGFGLIVMEWGMILYHIIRFERTGISKILKGGSL